MQYPVYERTPEEFREQFKYCKVYKVRAVESDGCTVHISRLYLTKGETTLRLMSTVDRKKMKGLYPGFRMQEGDLICISPDGTTSIQRVPNG